jgi:hypothetical protein
VQSYDRQADGQAKIPLFCLTFKQGMGWNCKDDSHGSKA